MAQKSSRHDKSPYKTKFTTRGVPIPERRYPDARDEWPIPVDTADDRGQLDPLPEPEPPDDHERRR